MFREIDELILNIRFTCYIVEYTFLYTNIIKFVYVIINITNNGKYVLFTSRRNECDNELAKKCFKIK